MKKQQEQVDQWIQTVGKRYFSELTNLGQLMEETGELSRLIIRKYGEQTWKKDEEPEDVKDKIAEELADIQFVILCLANQMNIDLEYAFEQKLAVKTKRDFQRHQSNPKL